MGWLKAQGVDINAQRQEPVVYGSLSSEHIYLAESSNGGGNGSAARAYEAAERLGTPEAFEEVIRRFPDSIYAAFARGQIDALNKARAEAEGKARAAAEVAAKGKELQDEHGHLAMHYAAEEGQVAAMGWLKAQGADINARNKYGNTPLGDAEDQGQTKAANWLAANGGRR